MSQVRQKTERVGEIAAKAVVQLLFSTGKSFTVDGTREKAAGIFSAGGFRPERRAVADLVEHCTPEAAALHAVNCVVPTGDGLVGENTDGPGFLDALRAEGRNASSGGVKQCGTHHRTAFL